MSMMDFMLDRRSQSLSNIVDTFDATHIISTEKSVAFHFTSTWFASDEALQLFDEEVAILRSVRHPWLLTPQDVIEDERERLLCYKPFKPGPSLASSLGELSDDVLLPLFEGLSEMAAMFHMKGAYCYFDPAVLFVSEPFSVQWLRLPRSFLSETTMPAPGGIFGSPDFRSPGQVRGDAMGPADDFFVLGAMLLAAKTGVLPFHCEKPADTLIKIIEGNPAGLDHESVTPAFRDLVERLLRQDESARLTDPDEIYERLQMAFGRAPFVAKDDAAEAAEDTDEPDASAEEAPESDEKVEAKDTEKLPAPPLQEGEGPDSLLAGELTQESDLAKESPADDVSEGSAAPDSLDTAAPDAVEDSDATSGESPAIPTVDEIAAEAEATPADGDSADAGDGVAVGTIPLSRISTLDVNRAEELLVPAGDDDSRDVSESEDVAGVSEDAPAADDGDAVEVPPALEAKAPADDDSDEDAFAGDVAASDMKAPEEGADGAKSDEDSGAPALTPPPLAPAAQAAAPAPPAPSPAPTGPVTPIPAAFSPPGGGRALTPPPLPPQTPVPASIDDATEEIPGESDDSSLTEAEASQIEKARLSSKRQEGKRRRKKPKTRSGTTGIFAGLIEEAVKADRELDDDEVPAIEEASEAAAPAPEAPEAPEAPAPEAPASPVSEAPASPPAPIAETPLAEGRRATVAFGDPIPELDELADKLDEDSLALLKPMVPGKTAADTAEAPAPKLDASDAEEVEESDDIEEAKELPGASAPSSPALTPPPFSVAKEKDAFTKSGQTVSQSLTALASHTEKKAKQTPIPPSQPTPPKGPGSLRKSTKAADTLISPAPVEVEEPVLELPPEFDSAADLDAIEVTPPPLDDLKESPPKELELPTEDADVALNEMADIDGEFDPDALDASIGGVRLDEKPAESTLPGGPPPSIAPAKRDSDKNNVPLAEEAELPLEEGTSVPPPEPILPPPTEDTVLPSQDALNADTAKSPLPAIGGNAGAATGKPAAAERKVKVLRRKGSVRYYKQMNPAKIFPLLVTILESEMYVKVPNIDNVVQKESDKVLQIKETSPMVRIVPVIPGCLVSPAEAVVDVRQKKVDAEFWVAPQNVGDLERSARVQIWHEGELKDEIKLPIRIKTHTLTRFMGSFSLFSTLGGAMLKAYGSVQPAGDKGFSAKIAKSLVGAFSASGIWLGVLFFLAALVCYFWLKPKKGDEVEMFLSSDLH